MMKILFVCKGNNCRSQMAEAIYNRLTKSNDASSAGTVVEGAGETLEEFGKHPNITSFTIEVMRDTGYDVRDKVQTQLTEDMLAQYDQIVSMAAKQYTPAWLANASNYVYWDVDDPAGRSYDITKDAKNEIEQRVKELIHAASRQ